MPAEITMTLPAESRFVATTRVTTASLAAELDFPVDRIEELRVGVNELAAALMEWAEDNRGDRIQLTFRVGTEDLEVLGEVLGAPDGLESEDDLDVLTGQILAGVTDDYALAGGHGRILKRRDASA